MANRPNQKVATQLVKVHAAALADTNRSSAPKVGDFYAYTKSLLPEIRTVADTRGNKDGKLSEAELKYLSAPARALVRFRDEMMRPARPVPKKPVVGPIG